MKPRIISSYPDAVQHIILPVNLKKPSSIPKPIRAAVKSVTADEECSTFILDHRVYHLICTDNKDYKALMYNAITCAKKANGKAIHIDLTGVGRHEKIVKAVIHGCLLSDYNIHLYQTKKVKKASRRISISGMESGVILRKIIAELTHQVEAQKLVMDIINAPSNKLTPAQFAQKIARTLKPLGIKVSIFGHKQLEQKGLLALLAVNRGSEDPARFVVMEYRAVGKSPKKHVGLIGKGITFDTGGISLKPSDSMHYMKSDLGGAAAVFGAMYMIGKQKPQVDVTAIIPTTDNSIGTRAIKPGDVIGSYSGKTIEVLNTDAEGRLVLADGLAYMCKNYKTDYLMDLATLTGSIVRALGYHAAGMFSKNRALQTQLLKLSDHTYEQVWPMPMWDQYAQQMKSEIADIKNLATKPVAGAITAAKFLEAFVDDHPAWVHLDIAAVAFGESPLSKEKCGTGWGPGLIWEWIKNIESSVRKK